MIRSIITVSNAIALFIADVSNALVQPKNETAQVRLKRNQRRLVLKLAASSKNFNQSSEIVFPKILFI